MFCTRCGIEIEEKACYCSQCGKATENARPFAASSAQVPLSRPREGKKIEGVCAGFARYFGVDVALVRIIWLVAALIPPSPGVIAYIVCIFAMPKDPLPASAPLSTATTH